VSAADLARPASPSPGPSRPAFRQFPTAWRFAVRNQTRKRLAGLLLAVFVPVWYLLMLAIAGHQPLRFRLYATGQVLTVDALLAFWRPSLAGWLAILGSFAVIALSYGSLGLLLGVLVKNDLEGFFLIITSPSGWPGPPHSRPAA
jgi:hypothetical protein